MIVTPDFLDTLDLSGPEHTSLLGTVTALYDVGCFFGAVYVSFAPNLSFFDSRDTGLEGPENRTHYEARDSVLTSQY